MSDQPKRRTCGTMQVHERLLRTMPEYIAARAASENYAHSFGRGIPSRQGVTVIPVVVHVVHNAQHTEQNITDAQVQSQIAVLNKDYRKKNPDVSTTPPAFMPLTADARIEFELAKTDPQGKPTNGITRTVTNAASFSDDDKVKSSATGGADPWPSTNYLNIWTCALGGGLLGYAQFPGGPANTDGVVILHSAFGTLGTAAAPFNLGRTATHEVGHWLNLRHIWGDDGNGCNGSDFVADTPNQAGPNYGTPGFPHVTCLNGPSGDMFMNYMDYVDDAAMFMFTTGQVSRIQACLDGDRSSIGTTKLEPTPKHIGEGGTLKFAEDPSTTKFTDDPATLKLKDDIQTLKFADDPQTLKFSDDPGTLKFRDDPQTLKFVDDPQTLKFVDDPQTLKFSDDPGTLKFRDDPTLKFVDDPQTLKFVDDPGTLKFRDDLQTSPLLDPVKQPALDKSPVSDVTKPPAADAPGIPGPAGDPGPVAPFVLATPHHSRAWTQSFPGAARAATQSYEDQIRQYEETLQAYGHAEQSGRLSPEDIHAANQLYQEYSNIVAEYRQMMGG